MANWDESALSAATSSASDETATTNDNSVKNGLALVPKLQNLILANEAYVDSLEACQKLINLHLHQKEEKETIMRAAMNRKVAVPVSSAMFRTPFFQLSDGTPAPTASSEVESGLNVDQCETVALRERWSKAADTVLVDLITKRKKELRLVDLSLQMKRINVEINKLQKSLTEKQAVDRVAAEAEILQKQTSVKDLSGDVDVIDMLSYGEAGLDKVALKNYDWFQVAQDPLLTRHGARACQLRFTHQLEPTRSKDAWTSEEDKILHQSVEQNGLHEWDAIAEKLRGRSPLDCCSRYRKLVPEQTKTVKGSRSTGESFSPVDVAKLIHGYLVGGCFGGVGAFLPERTHDVCYRYVRLHLDLNLDRSAFSDADLKIMLKFGRTAKSEDLSYLYRKFSTRSYDAIKAQFLKLFRREKKKWVEISTTYDPVADPGTGQLTALLQRLYDHVLTNITVPLREDLTLTLDELLTAPDIISPIILMMADLNLFYRAPQPEIPGSSFPVLSQIDSDLFEVFNTDIFKKPKRSGRPRKSNPFGQISPIFQPTTVKEKLDRLQTAIEVDDLTILVPPSFCTMDGLLKLKELCRDVDDVSDQVLSECDAGDLQMLHRRAQSLFLSSEIVVQHVRAQHAGAAAAEPEPALEEAFFEASEPDTPKAKGKPSKKRHLLKQRFAWFREKLEKEAEERRIKVEKRKLDEAAGKEVKRNKKHQPVLPVRQSGRLSLKKVTSTLDDGQTSLAVADTLDDVAELAETRESEKKKPGRAVRRRGRMTETAGDGQGGSMAVEPVTEEMEVVLDDSA